ncbi:hypothetical protein THRCLA_20620 [Thraustotheca clavata]|uniref:Uncharacterized protein n=1 Tax=Thraustotheca clavata TaxID=74557 RepID=A0A1W0A577_9STRA|nr:hypothetical protein THRCLA_20620 [Thraustotheca clavata]
MKRIEIETQRPSVCAICKPWLRELDLNVKLGYEPTENESLLTVSMSPSGWTQIPYQYCGSDNHITADVCAICLKQLRTEENKLSTMLNRVDVAKSDGFQISSTIACQICLKENELQPTKCQLLKEFLAFKNDTERLHALVKRFEKLAPSYICQFYVLRDLTKISSFSFQFSSLSTLIHRKYLSALI